MRRFPLVPIRSDGQLRAAYKVIDELAIIDEGKLTSGQADYLDVLSELTVKYEQQHHPMDLSAVDAVGVIQHLMEQQGMSASDLGRLLGHRELGGKILRRERQLSKAHVKALAEHFAVSPACSCSRRAHGRSCWAGKIPSARLHRGDNIQRSSSREASHVYFRPDESGAGEVFGRGAGDRGGDASFRC